MQKCYNCGKEVDDNVLICPDCGALVKRYGKPVPVEPDSYHQQPQPDAYPGAYEAPAQPGPRERVWLDAAGKPHFKGALCFWLIVCAVFAGYLLFGFGCMLLIYHAQGFFLDALAAFPEFSDLTDVLNLMLESIGNMKLGVLIDEDTAGDYDYTSSIASQTYDKVKLTYENKDTGKREVYIAQDSSHINQWGVLQYYEKLDSNGNAKAMADALLDLYNTKTRTLRLTDVLGDIRVRAGTLLVVMLGLGDINVSNYLMVEQCKHTFKDGMHLMELKMRGGTFVT